MKIDDSLLEGYENSKLLKYDEIDVRDMIAYEDLPSMYVPGVLKANRLIDGKLYQTYSKQDNHVGVIAATRLGKTTSYIIPTVLSFARQRVKRSMIISDPKGEIYRNTAETLRKEGYKIRLLNFRDRSHSECWNMLTPLFRKYQEIEKIADKVVPVEVDGEFKYMFDGNVYDDLEALDYAVETMKETCLDDVGTDIDKRGALVVRTEKKDDPYWDLCARDLFKAFLWAMLEDSDDPEVPGAITEDTYSFSTIRRLVNMFRDGKDTLYNDNGYFTKRPDNSQALLLAKNTLIENAPPTRKCVMSDFTKALSTFSSTDMRVITSCNSFELDELTEGPIAVFIDYRDELQLHYDVISLFVKDAYMKLIEAASDMPNGKLDVPFYFILDEFGNFPAMGDFGTTISACAGRNIFFILVVQSYAQLNRVYGEDVAEIIKDNLNVHVFFGSNNPATLEAFSKECGQFTRFAPISALNGATAEIDRYQIETLPLVPKSRLAHLEPGECIVTEANSGYVLFSKMDRYFVCDEIKDLPQSSEKDYVCAVNPHDRRYVYQLPESSSSRRPSTELVWG